MAAEAVVELENVRFTWPGQAAACLDIPRWSVTAGDRVFLYGPSGSGKSTLLALLGGVLVPERGTLKILGQELNRMPAARRDRFRADHIGFIFQLFNLVPYLSVLDNVVLPCRFSKRRRERAAASGKSVQDEARRLLSHLDIGGELLARPVSNLSVGQQQRVAAARALLGRPELIVADEPTSALDADRQQAFLQLLISECSEAGAALLFVSHDRRLSPAFTHEIALPSINSAHPEAAAA